jgi:SAM-dependent methyltransferase
MATRTWTADEASHYDESSAAMFAPEVLDPVVDVLAELAAGGRALEFAIGTGRVALPLRERGVEVHGIELSAPMVDRLREKPGGEAIPVTLGDMASARADGEFDVVYLVFNTLMNVTTQDEQVATFANAARHLRPGGVFVVEIGVPSLHPHAVERKVFDTSPTHVGIDTLDDPVGQISSSHHWTAIDGAMVYSAAPYRYVWPAELDLMGRCCGLRLRDRWSTWTGAPFTADSTAQVAVYEKPA